MTLSYLSRCFLISKLCASTFFCALAMELVTILCSMGSSSFMPRVPMIFLILSPAKILIRSSSRDRKNFDPPGSPWRPSAPELVVDAPGFVPLGADDKEAGGGDGLLGELMSVPRRPCSWRW